MPLFALVFFAVAMVLIGVGVAIGLVACALAAVLLTLGIISSSVVVGMRRGRAAAGIRALLLQCGILAGIPAGAVCAWLAHSFFEAYGQYGSGWPILVYGALGGAFAGLFVALALDFISRRFHAWASQLLPSRSKPTPSIDRS